MKAERCVFCASGAAETRDHVPPRSFFPAKLPHSTRLITIPCCNSCHKVSQATDAILRNLFISVTETESSQHVKEGLAIKCDRGFDRNRAEFLRLLRLVQRVEVKTPAGVLLRKDFRKTKEPLPEIRVRNQRGGESGSDLHFPHFTDSPTSSPTPRKSSRVGRPGFPIAHHGG